LPIAVAAVFASALLKADGPAESFRSFFGVHKVAPSRDGRFVQLIHGTTVHGAMRLTNDDGLRTEGRPEPITYYTYEGAIGRAVAAVRAAQGGALARVAVVGLGSGSLACHAHFGESWTFFEIDPIIMQIAQDPRFFRFLQDCAPDAPVVLGDARLTLADQPGGNSLIVLDAFSSDAIPIHLVTKEAIALFLSRLSPDGVLLFHISNRHVDLRHVLARAAAENGLIGHAVLESPEEPVERRYRVGSEVMVLARDPAHLGRIADSRGWPHIPADMARRPWSDDFSNILEAIRDRGWPQTSSRIAPPH
jgi:hypothetical protein